MTRAAPVHGLALTLLMSSAAWGQDPGTALVVLTPAVDLGTVTPDAPGGTPARFELVLRGMSPWDLAVVRLASGFDASPGDTVLVRTQAGLWVPLAGGVPVPIAAGMPTPGRGVAALALEVKVASSFDSPPGRHQVRLGFLVNHGPGGTEVALAFSVPPVTRMTAGMRPMQAAVLDPARGTIHRIEPQHYWITSNAPWVMRVQLSAPLAVKGSLRSMRHDAIRVAPAGGKLQTIVPNQPAVLASGPPTGKVGRMFDLQLVLSTTGEEVEGEYSSELQFIAEPTASGLVGRDLGALHRASAGNSNERDILCP